MIGLLVLAYVAGAVSMLLLLFVIALAMAGRSTKD